MKKIIAVLIGIAVVSWNFWYGYTNNGDSLLWGCLWILVWIVASSIGALAGIFIFDAFKKE